MSLLMEALKKAEEAKRRASEAGTPADTTPSPELSLKPLDPPAPSASAQNSRLPDLSQHIDSLDADLAAVHTEPPAKRRTPSTTTPTSTPTQPPLRETEDRTAARNVFSAKQAPRSSSGLWIFVGLSCVAALGLGAYFWWQLQAVSNAQLTRPTQPVSMSTQPSPTAPAVREPAYLAAAQPIQAEQERQPVPEIPRQKAATDLPARSLPAEKRVMARQRAPSQATEQASQESPESPVRLSKSLPKTNQPLERAYAAFQAGRLDEAQHDYELVLRSDRKNVDALLGLATIAANQGQSERAQVFFLHALESDPNDATAQAGVINTRGQASPGLSESRLKTALASQPESSALHFALGNLYARQSRWSEAQQAYFRAYATEPDNADFIFNLAVSLDHLHQNKLAAQYYQMALSAAATRLGSFDRNQVQIRILELQP